VALAREARGRGIPPSFPLLHAIIRYVRAFPEALQHPKEDAYPFPKLKARARLNAIRRLPNSRQGTHPCRALVPHGKRFPRSSSGYHQTKRNKNGPAQGAVLSSAHSAPTRLIRQQGR